MGTAETAESQQRKYGMAHSEPTVDMPTLFVPSVLLTVFCLSPFGLAAIKSSRRTAKFLDSGDLAAAAESFGRTQRILRLGFVVAIAGAAVFMSMQVLLTL